MNNYCIKKICLNKPVTYSSKNQGSVQRTINYRFDFMCKLNLWLTWEVYKCNFHNNSKVDLFWTNYILLVKNSCHQLVVSDFMVAILFQLCDEIWLEKEGLNWLIISIMCSFAAVISHFYVYMLIEYVIARRQQHLLLKALNFEEIDSFGGMEGLEASMPRMTTEVEHF